MHRRSVSGSATENTQHVLLQKSGSLHGAMAGVQYCSSARAAPSRFRAEAEAQSANAASTSAGSPVRLSRSTKGLSDEDIVCQSKLYDAYELQGFEQHLDRKLNFRNDRKTRSTSSSTTCQEWQKSLDSVSNSIYDHRLPADQYHIREHASCTRNSCNSDVRSSSFSTVSNVRMEPAAHLKAEAGRRCPQPRAADKNDPLNDDNRPASRSVSMRHCHYDGGPAGPARLAVQKQDTLQEYLQVHADQYPMSSTAKVLKPPKQSRSKRSRWPLVNLFFRAIHKKQNNTLITGKDATSSSTSMNDSIQQWNKEYQHHHDIVHYHHVHHHHHHHVVSGSGHFEEIDWPLSPTLLQELSKSFRETEDL